MTRALDNPDSVVIVPEIYPSVTDKQEVRSTSSIFDSYDPQEESNETVAERDAEDSAEEK